MRPRMRKGQKRIGLHKGSRIVFSSLSALVAASGCGYLIYMFLSIEYLPLWLRFLMIALCAIFIPSIAFMLKKYIQSLLDDRGD